MPHVSCTFHRSECGVTTAMGTHWISLETWDQVILWSADSVRLWMSPTFGIKGSQLSFDTSTICMQNMDSVCYSRDTMNSRMLILDWMSSLWKHLGDWCELKPSGSSAQWVYLSLYLSPQSAQCRVEMETGNYYEDFCLIMPVSAVSVGTNSTTTPQQPDHFLATPIPQTSVRHCSLLHSLHSVTVALPDITSPP